jgi:peptidyl-prolyl cis-trans isomerase C
MAASVAVAALVLVGCGEIASPDTVASVGDKSLSRGEFDDLVAATAGAPAGEQVTVERGLATEVLNIWLITEILDQELSEAGVTVSDDARDRAIEELTAAFGPQWQTSTPEVLRDLQIRQQSVIQTWSETPPAALDDAELAAIYALGPNESGIVCSAHILLDTDAEARETLSDLDAGADFAEVAAERSIDLGSAPDGGFLGCMGSDEFTQMFIPEFVQAALDAEIGTPVGPVETRFGQHIIVLPDYAVVSQEPLAELLAQPQTRFRTAARTAEVKVAPRYGTFDPATGVVALR